MGASYPYRYRDEFAQAIRLPKTNYFNAFALKQTFMS